MIRNVLVAGLALALVGFCLPAASAQSRGIGVMPKQINGEEARSWFVYKLSAGESVSDTVIVTNHSDQKKFIQIEALDALTTLSGNYSLIDSPADNKDIGTWVKVDAKRFYINPSVSQEVDFTVTVPEGASVGEHAGGIVVYEVSSSPAGGINIKTRIGARMYITVPGEVERKITFEDVSYSIQEGKLIFHIKAQNESNVKLQPTLDIVMTGLLGSRKQVEEQNGLYIAGAKMEFDRQWQRAAPIFGYYKVRLVFHTLAIEQTLADGTTSTLPDETFKYALSFWVGTQYLWWLLAALVLSWLIYRGTIYFFDVRKYRTKFEVYAAQAHENLNKIAEKTGIMASIIIKFNGLRQSYRIKKDDKFLIPKGFLTPSELARKTDRMPSLIKYLFTYKRSLYHPSVGQVSAKLLTALSKPKRRERKKR